MLDRSQKRYRCYSLELHHFASFIVLMSVSLSPVHTSQTKTDQCLPFSISYYLLRPPGISHLPSLSNHLSRPDLQVYSRRPRVETPTPNFDTPAISLPLNPVIKPPSDLRSSHI